MKKEDKEFRTALMRAASTPVSRAKDALIIFTAKVGAIAILLLVLLHFDAVVDFLWKVFYGN